MKVKMRMRDVELLENEGRVEFCTKEDVST